MTTIYARTHSVVCSPLDFIQRPLLWHEMIIRYRAHFTCAPNFAFGLVIKRLEQEGLLESADWSCLHCVVLGGEPTEACTLKRMTTALRVHPGALYSMFGMAECGLRVTAGPALTLADGIVSCGEACDALVSTRIVNADNGGRRVLLEGEVGSIWVRTQLAASGYWGQPELSEATFGNVLPGEAGVWLDTGDLGKIAEGQLCVTGRLKDVIIIYGKNHMATDVERCLEDAFATEIRLGSTAAFQHDSSSVGIVAEARKGGEKNVPAPAQLRALVQQALGVQVHYVCVCRPGTRADGGSNPARVPAASLWLAEQIPDRQRAELFCVHPVQCLRHKAGSSNVR